MYHLMTIIPYLKRFRIPFTRDQIMLAMVTVNLFFLGFEHFLAHMISLSLRPWELVPVIFGFAAGTTMLVAGIISFWSSRISAFITNTVLLLTMLLGVYGFILHVLRAIVPEAAIGDMISLNMIIWAPPILGPLTSAMIGFIGIYSSWRESPVDSGLINLGEKFRLQLPFSKSRTWFILVGLAILATTISSVLDHARSGFENNWLWIPVIVACFAVTVAIVLGMIEKPSRGDLIIYTIAMVLLICVGMLGAWLHYLEDINRHSEIVVERLFRHAPFLAPLLFADMGGFGLIVLLNPASKVEKKE